MITVKLLGGLGNQMFQAAYGMSLINRGYQVNFDKSSLIEGTHREYSLDCFAVLPFVESGGPAVYENGMRFNPDYLSPEDPCTMVGYWQSEKYFETVESQIRGLFNFEHTSRHSLVFNAIWNKVYHNDSIAIHVRRQDYVDLQHFHGMPSVEYYYNGIEFIRQHRLDTEVFVFSDDIAWCKENFPTDFHFVEGTNKYEDLQLMSSCNHAVIANSSFSWWGAWLQQRYGGIVVAPRQWFADPNVDYSDLVPQRWVKM